MKYTTDKDYGYCSSCLEELNIDEKNKCCSNCGESVPSGILTLIDSCEKASILCSRMLEELNSSNPSEEKNIILKNMINKSGV